MERLFASGDCDDVIGVTFTMRRYYDREQYLFIDEPRFNLNAGSWRAAAGRRCRPTEFIAVVVCALQLRFAIAKVKKKLKISQI